MKLRAGGFSLVELMVSITLGLVLLAGVAQVFVSSKQGYRVQESVGRLQENARYASGYLGQYIRMADLWSGVKPAAIKIKGAVAYAGPGSCTDSWIVDPANGIVGYSGDSAGTALTYPGALPAGCIGSTTTGTYIPGSDMVVIRYVDPNTYTAIDSTVCAAAALPNSSQAANGKFYLRTLVGKRADLFDITSSAACTGAVGDITGDATNGDITAGVLNYQYQTVAFYLLNADNGQGLTPTLYMLTLQSDKLTAQPLVDGIEMLKFEYGVDTNGDGRVDKYAVASSLAATDWARVVTVRASFIARGDAIDTYNDTQSYTMTGGGYVYTPSSAVSKFQRRLIVREIQLRNRVRQ